jgi:DNA mismatch repair protein MutS2
MLATRTLEFDRIVERVTALALTPMGARTLAALAPSTDAREVVRAQQATSETSAYLERHPLFPLRAGAALDEALDGLATPGRPLEPLPLLALADFVESIEHTRRAIVGAGSAFPILGALAARVASLADEVAAVRHAIGAGGEVVDGASLALKRIRHERAQKRQRLRGALDEFVRSRESSRYLQDTVVTERSGRFVLLVRAEHRANVPGIVHGASASGATLFLEPAATVDLNNDIVELEEREREEILRILLELADRFRRRASELAAMQDVAATLDALQARARYSARIDGVEPKFAEDGSLELRAARHPLLVERAQASESGPVVPVDLVLEPPSRVLLITGPNTGGKTVALKTAGLLALMAQAGLHVPASAARLPVFQSVFADIGDEQSIAASLSTFSAHIGNIAEMDRDLALPALVLLDEVGTGTDPNEGGALAAAIVQHFRQRGAAVVATTHFDAVKTWGLSAEGVVVAGFAFDPQTFAPTYRLAYGVPGRSLAIEVGERLGLPRAVVAAARGFLNDDQKRLQAHLARLDAQARALESERAKLEREKRALGEADRALRDRERSVAEREAVFKKRLNERLDERLRQAGRDIDTVIEDLKTKSALAEKASTGGAVTTGDAGAARAAARAETERIVEALRGTEMGTGIFSESSAGEKIPVPISVGTRVELVNLGVDGTVLAIAGSQADVDVRGKRLKVRLADLRAVAGPPSARASVRVNVDLKPREGSLTELNVIGCSVDEACDRLARFLDDTLVTDVHEVRIVHGHGTGQLRKGLHAFLKEHPLVEKFYLAPENQGGGGATIVELKD